MWDGSGTAGGGEGVAGDWRLPVAGWEFVAWVSQVGHRCASAREKP